MGNIPYSYNRQPYTVYPFSRNGVVVFAIRNNATKWWYKYYYKNLGDARLRAGTGIPIANGQWCHQLEDVKEWGT